MLLAVSTSGQAEELTNLGKLASTSVEASSVNAGRPLDNVFYGVLNLFDGGQNVVNNINYTYWLSDAATRHWVKLRFGAPVEIHSILLEFNAENTAAKDARLPSRRPEGFAVDITRSVNGIEVVEKLPAMNVEGFRVIYPLRATLRNVLEMAVVFPGPSMIEVAEVEVLGITPEWGSQNPKGPTIADR